MACSMLLPLVAVMWILCSITSCHSELWYIGCTQRFRRGCTHIIRWLVIILKDLLPQESTAECHLYQTYKVWSFHVSCMQWSILRRSALYGVSVKWFHQEVSMWWISWPQIFILTEYAVSYLSVCCWDKVGGDSHAVVSWPSAALITWCHSLSFIWLALGQGTFVQLTLHCSLSDSPLGCQECILGP
jgi:hypothetical protein